MVQRLREICLNIETRLTIMSYHNRSGKGFVYVILNAINTNDTRSYSYPLVLKYYTRNLCSSSLFTCGSILKYGDHFRAKKTKQRNNVLAHRLENTLWYHHILTIFKGSISPSCTRLIQSMCRQHVISNYQSFPVSWSDSHNFLCWYKASLQKALVEIPPR